MVDLTRSAITILGSGSWGSALAVLLASNGVCTRLWGRNKAHMQTIQKYRYNKRYLPNICFPAGLNLYDDLRAALANVQDILIAVPSHAFASIITQLSPLISSEARIAWATKGLEPHSGFFLHKIVKDQLGLRREVAVLSGPSFALEVAKGLPTAVALASKSDAFAQSLIDKLHNQNFRIYLNDDLIGVQLCGALKNVFAIATGMACGLGLGANTQAALITRSLAEMTRLGLVLGAKQTTFLGLAGVGDLVLTCTDNQSRNRRFGIALGEGANLEEAKDRIDQVIEGIANTEQVFSLGQTYQIEMPITSAVRAILKGEITPKQAVNHLLSRKPTTEF